MKSRSHYWQLLPYLRPHWFTLLLALIGTLGFVATMPLTAYLVGQGATLLGQGKVMALAKILGLVVLLFLVRGVCLYVQDTLMAKAALQMVLDLRYRVYNHLQRLGLDYFETVATGDLSYRLTEEIDQIGEVVKKMFYRLLPSALTLLAILIYLFSLNWQLTLATLIMAPLLALLTGWFGQRLLQYSRVSQDRISNLSALLTEVFSGIRLIKAFVAEDYQSQRFLQQARQNQQARYAAEQMKAIQYTLVAFLEALGICLLFLLGGWQIAQGYLTAGGFISFGAGIALIIEPIQQIIANYSDFKQGQAAIDRVFELLEHRPNIEEKPQAQELPSVKGEVEYRRVHFAYQWDQPVLQGISLQAQPGEVIALVGHSGSGKSTLVNLLLRFYDPHQGEILIDGIDIQNVTLNSLRRQIALVPQETILFSGSIADNIAFGLPHWDLQDIVAAAKIANAHEFIARFAQGYQTWVGERGINLSGGQRQRLAIARAILRNPKILILDEATSALDSESEALVQQALERVMAGRTVFIIAHRLATVRRADRILVVEQGQIVESGTHAELLAQQGGQSRYARFYAHQFPN